MTVVGSNNLFPLAGDCKLCVGMNTEHVNLPYLHKHEFLVEIMTIVYCLLNINTTFFINFKNVY